MGKVPIKRQFYGDLDQVLYHFPKYHLKIILGDFNAKVGRENSFKSKTGNESLLHDINNNGVRIVNFARAKIFLLRAGCSHTKTFISKLGPLLTGRLTTRLITY